LLAEGDRATITTAIGERLQVRVAEGDGDVVLFVLMLGPGESLDAESPARVLLEFPCVQGIAQVRGDATLADDDLVRFHVCNAIEVVQRRRFFRVRTPRRVDVTSDDGLLSTYSVDISGCGMLMTGPEALETGDQIRFRLHIGDDEIPIEGGARVVRTAADGHRAIEFEQFPRQEEERLIRFLFDRQRAERAITRGDLHKAGGAR
jgi:hypothetical protein